MLRGGNLAWIDGRGREAYRPGSGRHRHASGRLVPDLRRGLLQPPGRKRWRPGCGTGTASRSTPSWMTTGCGIRTTTGQPGNARCQVRSQPIGRSFGVGQDGWLTASLSARDWDKDGVIENPPSMTTRAQTGGYEVVLDVPEHTAGSDHQIDLPAPVPVSHRVQRSRRSTLADSGTGRWNTTVGPNGYSDEGCKTQHPWGEGSNTPGWSGDAADPYCKWQDVREGPYGYNGFHFLSIVDFANPTPRNNHFWHYRRKVLIDSFAQHPDPDRRRHRWPGLQRRYEPVLRLPGQQLQHRQHVDQRPAELDPASRWSGWQLAVVHDELLRRRRRATAVVAAAELHAGTDAEPVLRVCHRAERDWLHVGGERTLRSGRAEDAAFLPPVRRRGRAHLALQQRSFGVRRAVQRQPCPARCARQHDVARPVARWLPRTPTTSSSVTLTRTWPREVPA